MHWITAKFVAAATVVAMIGAGAAVSSVGVESYLGARSTAYASLEAAQSNISASDTRYGELRAEIANLVTAAQQAVTDASGKTADSTGQEAVNAAIQSLSNADAALLNVHADFIARWQRAQAAFAANLWWPPTADETVRSTPTELDASAVDSAKHQLTQALGTLSAARAAWQAEQDRIAAEQAAAEAAARAAAARRAAASSISSSGGKTAPNAPTLSTDTAPPAPVSVETVESFLGNLVSGASVVWNADLCQPGTICGTTTLSSSAPVITLDTDLRDYYLGTSPGRYVLVHEAAHARSWYRYGSTSALIAASVAVTGIPDNGGRAAVERMADCATVVKAGMVIPTFTYLQGTTCSPAELAEAATYWQ